ncbi:MAG: ComEA family DNA-binding protein [Fidelibacterota bacterium]
MFALGLIISGVKKYKRNRKFEQFLEEYRAQEQIFKEKVRLLEGPSDSTFGTFPPIEAKIDTSILSNPGRRDDKINLNTAERDELVKIPGIGPKIAERILNYRKNIGRFESIEEIKNVQGVGERTFKKIKEHIYVE